jgi:transcription elongation factor GreB
MPGIRYRPPQQASTALITRAGYERLRDELDDLSKHQRPEVIAALSAAAAEGDRSENAEYTYRKKQLGGIDRRIRYLGKLLNRVQVVEHKPHDQTRIFFGATVELENADGTEETLRIVGPDETDTAKSWISIDSPLAKALLKKSVDDEVRVETPGGVRTLYVLSISYPDDA